MSDHGTRGAAAPTPAVVQGDGRDNDAQTASDRGGRSSRAPVAVLLLVVASFLITQWFFIPRTRPVLWDEAVYITQVTPGMRGAYFDAWHTRGMVLLVAPVASLGGSMEALRTYLALLSGFATFGAYAIWIRSIGVAAALAAMIFSFAWVTLIAAGQAMPNYWAGLLGVAATGMWVRWLEGRRPALLAWASSLLALMTFTRPTEGSLLFLGWAVATLFVRRRVVLEIAWSALAVVLGWLPWLIEMSFRFGGPIGAVREARTGGHFERSVDIVDNLLRHLAFASGKRGDGHVFLGATWWALVVSMGIVALIRSRSGDRAAVLVASSGGLAMAGLYLLFVPAFTSRFLLPAYGLATIPAAIGVMSLVRGSIVSRVIAVVVGVAMAAGAVWQVSVAVDQLPKATHRSAIATRIGSTIRRLSDGRACYFMTARAYPEIALASRCQGRKVRGVPTAQAIEQQAPRAGELFVVALRRFDSHPILYQFEPIPIRTGGRREWLVYHVTAVRPDEGV